MHTLQRLIACALLAVLTVLAGCGGGGGEGARTTTVTGIALISAPISGALVEIHQLTAGGAPGALLGSGSSGADGRFSIAIPAAAANEPFLVTVSGRSGASYLSPSGAGIPFASGERLRSAVEAAPPAALAVTPLTDAAYRKLQLILTANPALPGGIAQGVKAANSRIGALNGIDSIVSDPASDPAHRATLLVLERMLANLRTADSSAGSADLMALLNGAWAGATLASPDYQRYLQAFDTAAGEVIAANPGNGALAGAVTLLRARAAAPPAEPDFTDSTPPGAPQNLTATASALSASAASVRLTWFPSSDSQLAGYDIFRNGVKIASVIGPGYSDSTVSFNVSYSYSVLAFDAAGNRSPLSNEARVTPVAPPLDVVIGGGVSGDILTGPDIDNVPPAAPVTFSAVPTATGGATSSVRLSWSASTDDTGIAGYRLFRDGVLIATLTALSYDDPSLASGVGYRYAVAAFDAAGNRSALRELFITPALAPLGITVSGGVSLASAGSLSENSAVINQRRKV